MAPKRAGQPPAPASAPEVHSRLDKATASPREGDGRRTAGTSHVVRSPEEPMESVSIPRRSSRQTVSHPNSTEAGCKFTLSSRETRSRSRRSAGVTHRQYIRNPSTTQTVLDAYGAQARFKSLPQADGISSGHWEIENISLLWRTSRQYLIKRTLVCSKAMVVPDQKGGDPRIWRSSANI